MNENVKYLKNTFENNSDFVLREIETGTKDKVYIAFFESLVNASNLYSFVIKNIYHYRNLHKKVNDVLPLIGGPKLVYPKGSEDMFYYLENGYALIFHKSKVYGIEVKAELDRGITISQTEPNMYGPKDSFCENIQKNLGVLKRRVKNKNLKIESVDRGIYTKNKMALVYIEDKVNKGALESIKKKLDKFNDREVTDSYDLAQELKLNHIFPTILKTEKPAIATKFLLKGYIVISLDNAPFAMVIDAKFGDFINPFTTDKFVQVLRYICLLLTILTPALYISLINFNQETIPTSLLINFAEQRSGVPFPAIVEAVIMLLICEILRESDIRFPSNYGSSASILGALVLGEAAVNAGIVSPIMIIVVAISFVSGLIFTGIKLVGAIRIMRFAFLVIASFLGLYGLAIAVIACISIISNVNMYEGTYL